MCIRDSTRVMGLSCGVVCVILRLAVLIRYRSVTDRQTDTHTHRHTHRHTTTAYTALSIASRGKNHMVEPSNFYECHLWLWSSDGVAICWVLPVLWMASCFHTMGPIDQNQARRYISKKFARWRYQFDVRQLQCLAEFIRMRHRGVTQSASYDCLSLV